MSIDLLGINTKVSDRLTQPSTWLRNNPDSRSTLPFVNANHLRLGDDVGLRLRPDVLGLRRRRHVEPLRIKSGEPEMIVVRPMALRRLGSIVAGVPEPVHTLPYPAASLAGRSFWQAGFAGGDVVHRPMPERARRRVGILDDQHEALGFRRRIPPLQRRREVVAAAGVAGRDDGSVALTRQATGCSGDRAWQVRYRLCLVELMQQSQVDP